MATKEQNEASARKVAAGKDLNQDEQRALDRASHQAGSQGSKLNRLMEGKKK